MDLSTSQAAPDIRFFRNTGVALIASATLAGAITLTLTLSGDDSPVQIDIAGNITQPATQD
jgi:hypothetical protein